MPLQSSPDLPAAPVYAPPAAWTRPAGLPDDRATLAPADGAPIEVPTPGGPAAAAEPPAVEVVGVTKHFRARRGWRAFLRRPLHAELAQVLDQVSFSVRPGEFFGLLGPNGAGKTTLFRVLATSVLPDAGHAEVCGYDVDRDVAHVRGSVSCVMANDRSLFWRLSAKENLRLFAALYALPRAATERRIGEVLALVGLADVGPKPVGNFSAGMRQRLLIARAILPRPRVLLLDEPTRSLDPIAAREFRRFLRTDVATAEGCTVLLATHSSEEALTLCDRLAVLHRGRVLATGTAAELQARFGDQAFVVWTRTPGHPAFAALEHTGRARRDGLAQSEGGGWWRVRLVVGGALDDAGAALAALTAAGADVARFEQADLDLAELLERVVARETADATR